MPDQSPLDTFDIPDTFTMTAPGGGGLFDGVATGKYWPQNDPTITAYFWYDYDTSSGSVPAAGSHDEVGVVELKAGTPARLPTWTATFPVTGTQNRTEGTRGFVRASKVTSTTKPTVREAPNLTWYASLSKVLSFRTAGKNTPAGGANPNNNPAAGQLTMGLDPLPAVLIQSHEHNQTVGRKFVVYGRYDRARGTTVIVKLLRSDNTEVRGAVSLTEYLDSYLHWVAMVDSPEMGDGYKLRAQLVRADGDNAGPPHTIAGLYLI